MQMRVIYMGTPDFAVASLKALAEQGTDEIVGVFTQPDRPKGMLYAAGQGKGKEQKASTDTGEGTGNGI